MTVEPVLPLHDPLSGTLLARGVRAGRWVFVCGAMATDGEGKLARELASNPRPLSGLPRGYTEATVMYTRTAEVLAAGGSYFAQPMRTDQYLPDWRAVPFLHQARREFCSGYVAPSTSILGTGPRPAERDPSLEHAAGVQRLHESALAKWARVVKAANVRPN